MLTLLTVNYRNYDLLNFQLDHMSKLEGIQDYRLIVVENTPKRERIAINHPLISEIVHASIEEEFDGVSHGKAIDLGLTRVNTEFVFIFDTDFFILKKNFFPFFLEKMKQGYDAIGSEFFDGRDWKPIRERFPESFSNLPVPWGTIYRSKIAKSESWVVTMREIDENSTTGFIDVGWRHRKKLIERGKNTLVFDGYQKNYEGQGNCYFRYEGEDVAFHYMRASYDRMQQSMQEIKKFMKKILIIGSNGYVGTRLHLELSKKYNVHGCDINEGLQKLSETTDILDYRDLTKEEIEKYDAIVLLAGHSSVKMCEGNPIHSLSNNVTNFLRLLEMIDKDQCLIYAGSSSVYGKIGSNAAREEDVSFVPYNNYDLTKNIIDQYASLSGKNYYGLRFGTVNGYSPITREDIMINAMTKNSVNEGKIKLFSAKTNRPILDIADLCNAIETIIEKNDPSLSGIYNLCSFNSTSEAIANEVARITGSTVENFDNQEDTSLNRSVYDFSIDNSKFCNVFDWTPKGTIESIVHDLLQNMNDITFVNRNHRYEYER